VERGIGDLDAVADEQLADLREPDAVTEPALDRWTLFEATRPASRHRAADRPRGAARAGPGDLLVGDRCLHADAGVGRGPEIPPDRLRIEPELGGDPLLRQPFTAEP
jgi:hypothetical protein